MRSEEDEMKLGQCEDDLPWRYDAIQTIMMDFTDAEVNSGGWEWRIGLVVVGLRPMDTLES